MAKQSREEPGGYPANCSGGIRRRGGASPVQAPEWNVGSCDPDADPGPGIRAEDEREKLKRQNREGESTEAGHAVADCLVVAMKPRNGGGATGAGYPGLVGGQLPGRRSR